MTELLMEGIRSSGRTPQVNVISDISDAIRYAVEHAPKGAFITVSTESPRKTIDFVQQLLSEEGSVKEETNAGHALSKVFHK